MSSVDSKGRRGKVAEEQVLLNEIPSRNGVSVTPTRAANSKRGKFTCTQLGPFHIRVAIQVLCGSCHTEFLPLIAFLLVTIAL